MTTPLPSVLRVEDLPMPTRLDYMGLTENVGDAADYTRRTAAKAADNRRLAEAACKAIPARFRDAVPEHPAILQWVADVVRSSFTPSPLDELEYHQWSGPSLLIVGNVGSGKTFQAYGAIRALAGSGLRMPNFCATTASDLYAAVRPRQGVDSEDEFRRFAHARVLLVDDLGVRPQGTDWTHELDYRLVNTRYDRNLPTIFTTNLTASNLAQAMSERVVSRLAEMSTLVDITGPDRRRGDVA